MRIEKIKKLLADYNKKKSIFKNDSLIITYLKKCLTYNFIKDNENLDLPVFLKSFQDDHNIRLTLKDLDAISMETDLFESWWLAESLEILPNEIMDHLFSFLQVAEKKSVMATCRHFFSLGQDKLPHETFLIEDMQTWTSPVTSKNLPKISIVNNQKELILVVDKVLEFLDPLSYESKESYHYDSPITANPIIMEEKRSTMVTDLASFDEKGNAKLKEIVTTHRKVFTGHKTGEVYLNNGYVAPQAIISGLPDLSAINPIDDYHIATGHTNGDVRIHKFNTKLTNLDLEYESLSGNKLNDTPQIDKKSLIGKNKQHTEAIFALLNYENILYSCSAKTISKWNLMSGVTKILNPFKDVKNNDLGNFTAIDLLDKKTLLVGTDKGYIFKYDFCNAPIILGKYSNEITKIAHHKNNILTCAADGAVQVWLGQLTNIKCVQVFQSIDGKIKDFHLSNEGILMHTEKNVILKYKLVEKTIQKENQQKPTVEIKKEEIKEETIGSKLAPGDYLQL